jgi:hypothetical protein
MEFLLPFNEEAERWEEVKGGLVINDSLSLHTLFILIQSMPDCGWNFYSQR